MSLNGTIKTEAAADLPPKPSDKPSADATGHLIDRWLRFEPALGRQYDVEYDAARSAHLREAIFVGLALFNLHNLTNALLLPDMFWLAVAGRLTVVTPVALIAALYLPRMTARLRERTAFSLVTSAFAIEVLVFWTTRAPLGAYSFSEFGLTLVYGNMLMALRFRHAVLFTAVSFALAVLVVWQRPLLDEALRFAFVTQIAMACIISLYANYKTERRRCDDYVVAHLALARAEQADSAKRRFEDQSKTDPLTGLPNRRLLDELLRDWLASEPSVAVMMLDIDHFKLFNDTLGHQAGDACLRKVGAVLAAAAVVHAPDVLCARFGGEEFTVALRNADEAEAARFAASLLRSIEALGIAHPGRSDGIGVVTASLGIALRTAGSPAEPDVIVAEADQALYRAKRNGRNRFALGRPDGVNDIEAAAA